MRSVVIEYNYLIVINIIEKYTDTLNKLIKGYATKRLNFISNIAIS